MLLSLTDKHCSSVQRALRIYLSFSALTLMAGWQEYYPACKKNLASAILGGSSSRNPRGAGLTWSNLRKKFAG